MRKSLKRTMACVLALSMLAGMQGVTGEKSASAAKVKVKSVSVEAPYAKNATIALGKSIKLTPVVNVTPDKKANKKVTYKSSNAKVVTVNKKGVVKAKKAGSAKITVASAKNKKKKATVKINVVKKAVKSVSLNKKKASLKPGETLKLKATIKPKKGVNKDIIWESSKQKIATVDANGKVTAVAPGKSVITATAADGSKKSAKCNVTVQDVTNLVNVEAMDSETLCVTISKPTALGMADFQIKGKSDYEGKYVRDYTVKGLVSSDTVNYYVSIDGKESFYNDEYLMITVPSLSGTKSKEIKVRFPVNQAELNEAIIEGYAGKNISVRSIGFGDRITGAATYTVTGLPAGILYKNENGSLYIYGKSDAVVDNVIATATATDENGITATRKIRFLIGSADAIVTYVQPCITLVDTKSINSGIYIVGGSGSYSTEIDKNVSVDALNDQKVGDYSAYDIEYGVYNYSNGSGLKAEFYLHNSAVRDTAKQPDPLTGKVYYKNVDIPAGEYSFVCKIKDNIKETLTKDIPVAVSVRNGAIITGVLKDAAGEAIVGRKVSAYCTSNNYVASSTSILSTDATGAYKLRVVENEVYNVYGCGAEVYKQTIPATGATINLSSPLYRVKVNTPVTGAVKVGSLNNEDPVSWNNEEIYDYTSFYLSDITYTGKNNYSNSYYDEYDDYDYSDGSYYFKNNIAYMQPGTYALYGKNISAYGADEKGKATVSIGKFDAEATVVVANANVEVTAVMTPSVSTEYKLTLDTPVAVTVPENESVNVTVTGLQSGTYVITSDPLTAPVYFDGHNYSKGDSIYSEVNIYGEWNERSYNVRNSYNVPISIANLKISKKPEPTPDPTMPPEDNEEENIPSPTPAGNGESEE